MSQPQGHVQLSNELKDWMKLNLDKAAQVAALEAMLEKADVLVRAFPDTEAVVTSNMFNAKRLIIESPEMFARLKNNPKDTVALEGLNRMQEDYAASMHALDAKSTASESDKKKGMLSAFKGAMLAFAGVTMIVLSVVFQVFAPVGLIEGFVALNKASSLLSKQEVSTEKAASSREEHLEAFKNITKDSTHHIKEELQQLIESTKNNDRPEAGPDVDIEQDEFGPKVGH